MMTTGLQLALLGGLMVTAGLVLLGLVLFANIAARLILSRKLSGSRG